MMDFKNAVKHLPSWARGLAEGCTTTDDLRDKVLDELKMCREGENPLDNKQAQALYQFLEYVPYKPFGKS